MAEVSLRDVRKSYGHMEAIHGVNITVADREFVALVGPSGCGKSTLLRMIAGLEEITSGEIAIGGRVVNGMEPKERDIAMVFQNYALYPHKTVAENMGFSLKLRGVKPAEIRERVTEAAAILGLSDFLDRLPKAMSGGQRQRVAMGRAIVRDPAVFLFDEPLSNLDAALRVQMRAEIRALHERLGSTSIFVTHDQIEAMTMADRIIVLRSGNVEQAGAPMELYDRPANAFVASFIGSPAMNLLPGTAAEGRIHLSDALSIPAPVPCRGAVTWGIRPEHVEMTGADAPGAIPARVTLIENTGMASYVVTEAGGVRISVIFTSRPDIRRGDEIWLNFDALRQHVFDALSGARL